MQTAKSLETRMLFTLGEAATLCDLDEQYLRNLVSGRLIQPAERGGRGRGHSHKFTVQQLIGLCFTRGGWVWKTRRLGAYFKQEMEDYSRWSWSAVSHFLGLRRDDWSEEELQKALCPEPLPFKLSLSEYEPTPGDLELVRHLTGCVLRIRKAVLDRLGVSGAAIKDRRGPVTSQGFVHSTGARRSD